MCVTENNKTIKQTGKKKMTEQAPSPANQQAAEQFDAETAQRARAMLDEGVQRAGDDGVGETHFAKDGEIVDTQGTSLAVRAEGLYRDHKKHSTEMQKQATEFVKGERILNNMTDRRRELDSLDRSSAGLTASQEREYSDLEQDMGDVKEPTAAAKERFDEAHKESKVNLWDAHEHLQENRAAYETAALEDATAAGHDVRFGGQQSILAQQPPAPEQPKQPK